MCKDLAQQFLRATQRSGILDGKSLDHLKILGLDVTFDAQGQPHLLEIERFASLSSSDEITGPIKRQLLDDVGKLLFPPAFQCHITEFHAQLIQARHQYTASCFHWLSPSMMPMNAVAPVEGAGSSAATILSSDTVAKRSKKEEPTLASSLEHTVEGSHNKEECSPSKETSQSAIENAPREHQAGGSERSTSHTLLLSAFAGALFGAAVSVLLAEPSGQQCDEVTEGCILQ